MAYKYNIPQATDQISVSQGDILGNFTALGAIAGNTQVASSSLNTSPGSGFNYLYISPQGSKPPITFPSGNVALYSAAPIGGLNELYINKDIKVAGATVPAQQIPATAATFGSALLTDNGISYLPSGLIIQWGTLGMSIGQTSKNISFTSPNGSFPNANFNVQVTQAGGATFFTGTYYISAKTTSNATLTLSSALPAAANFYWVAIGY